jgi:hypothetical protein
MRKLCCLECSLPARILLGWISRFSLRKVPTLYIVFKYLILFSDLIHWGGLLYPKSQMYTYSARDENDEEIKLPRMLITRKHVVRLDFEINSWEGIRVQQFLLKLKTNI